eukprot:CAMPEP_0181244228 /NCGR_PEP_ID=MMETSP1096-20121128/42735_1 /TAXON_ID=156174 ORGANISM="Chrysochromulina ericina, Strain CCMP281" /NCGR_SAMPLE_ID=MMETSP1096 /ASSEMBLY_ACC=CAM_ASM_000453 /LENGTH=55 /DNA_ID=CAMNT_0023340737 /DNA_START=191 /DNA_END=354 /DNA_ORIENTATION=-
MPKETAQRRDVHTNENTLHVAHGRDDTPPEINTCMLPSSATDRNYYAASKHTCEA